MSGTDSVRQISRHIQSKKICKYTHYIEAIYVFVKIKFASMAVVPWRPFGCTCDNSYRPVEVPAPKVFATQAD